MFRILIVEDNRPISDLIKTHLLLAGYEPSQVYDGLTALELLQAESFDLLILDLMLPGVDGKEVIRRVKNDGIPIIVVSAVDNLTNQVECLQLGADDYIVKPFDGMDLQARVGAVLRRCRKTATILTSGSLEIYSDTHRTVQDGQEIDLTPKEYDLLYYLVSNKNKVLSRKEILTNVWGYQFAGETRTVDIHVQRLRKKLGWAGDEIQTVMKVGYILTVE